MTDSRRLRAIEGVTCLYKLVADLFTADQAKEYELIATRVEILQLKDQITELDKRIIYYKRRCRELAEKVEAFSGKKEVAECEN